MSDSLKNQFLRVILCLWIGLHKLHSMFAVWTTQKKDISWHYIKIWRSATMCKLGIWQRALCEWFVCGGQGWFSGHSPLIGEVQFDGASGGAFSAVVQTKDRLCRARPARPWRSAASAKWGRWCGWHGFCSLSGSFTDTCTPITDYMSCCFCTSWKEDRGNMRAFLRNFTFVIITANDAAVLKYFLVIVVPSAVVKSTATVVKSWY